MHQKATTTPSSFLPTKERPRDLSIAANKTTTSLSTTPSSTNTTHPLLQKDINKTAHTLGVHLCPTGLPKTEYAWLRTKINNLRALIDKNKLGHREITAAYKFYYLPSITYPFPVSSFTLKECNNLQGKITTSFLLAQHYNRNMPCAVVYRPPEYGGLDF